jgi:hypothetical protein
MTSTTHAVTYVRTEAGQAEISANSIKLSRRARNILLLIDASCTGEEWVGKISGSTAADLDMLLAAELIAPKVAGSAETAQIPVDVAVRNWKYDALYALLTREAKERFGLIKGFRLVLKIEGCSDLASMQAVALEFVELIRKAHGEESAARFRKQLGATN